MNTVSALDIARAGSYNFEFTYTYRDEAVNMQSLVADVVLDTTGKFYILNKKRDDYKIMIIGGIDKYVNARSRSVDYPFFLTVPQKISLYTLMRHVSSQTEDIEITSSNETLESMMNTLYFNYVG